MPPWKLVLYSYRRADLTLEIYRDRIVMGERVAGVERALVVPTATVRTVQVTTRGWLLLELDDGRDIGYELGQAAAEVGEVIKGLL